MNHSKTSFRSLSLKVESRCLILKPLFLKVSSTVNETTVPVLCNKLSQFESKFPESGNGRRRSYSFWIYIYDIAKNAGNYRTIAAVSNDKLSFS